MKIAILSFYSGKVDRGVETWTYELSSLFKKHGHDVVVYQNKATTKKINYRTVTTDLKVDWNKPDSTGTLLRRFFIDYWSLLIAKFTIKLLPSIWKNNYDIVIPTNGGWQPAFLRILCWIKHTKLVIVGHSGIGWDDRNNIMAFPDLFIALSKKAQKWAKRSNPLLNTTVIPNGVDVKKFKPEGEVIEVDMQSPIIACVSALIPSKRVDLAIKAVAKLETASLLLLGDGDKKEEYEALGKKLLKDRFMVKQLDYGQMAKAYRAADLFTIPSESQYSFEIVLLEAMATNLPVVANDDEIRKEIVGNAGILVDPEDVDKYSDSLRSALEMDWGDRPRRQAEKFSWEKVAEEYESELNKLIES